MASYIFGSARIDEHGNARNGAAGDQKQTGTGDDYKGEVSMQSAYTHSKGWYVFRFKSDAHAVKAGERMRAACNNPNLGYSQSDRYGVIKNGIDSKVKTNCDCSSLVRQCIKEATGVDVGDFATSGQPGVLNKSGLFQAQLTYTPGMTLYIGDVLVTKTSGHTVIVVVGDKRGGTGGSSKTDKAGGKSLEQVVQDVIDGKYGNNPGRRQKLEAEGWNYETVRVAVNAALGQGNVNKPAIQTTLITSSSKTVGAKSKDTKLAGSYRATEALNLRKGPSKDYAKILTIPSGGVVRMYGYYTETNGVKWFYVDYEGTVGYCSSNYLKKV